MTGKTQATAERSIEIPHGLLAELTHRCPLQCPYCSNPLELDKAGQELTTAEWVGVLQQAAELGVLQVHLSGGEPTARKDLPEIVAAAAGAGLYTNLITAGVLSTKDKLATLYECGLDHVQLSIQDTDAANADRIGGFKGGLARKLEFAGWVRDLGIALTLNAPLHRQNIDNLPAMIDLAVELGARRLEAAHVQYYGWALANRAALMPSYEQTMRSAEIVERARAKLKGILSIDFVVPDYYAKTPKPCMGGWGRRFMNVTPSGLVLPCHAAQTIPGMSFENVRQRSLRDIWLGGAAFNAFRGGSWMRAPCRSCERREIDWGGCRCQAFALTGDARNADPACAKSPFHAEMVALAITEATDPPPPLNYRRIGARRA